MCVCLLMCPSSCWVISERFRAAARPRRRTAPCTAAGTESEPWAGSADWTSAASPCAGCTASAALPSSGTAAERKHTGMTSTCFIAGLYPTSCSWPRHTPCALDCLGCRGGGCVWDMTPRSSAPSEPGLGPPDTDDLHTNKSILDF